MQPRIESLIARAQDGDVRAFEELIAEHIAAVRRFARGFAPTDAEADDLAQDALLKCYRSLGSYRLQSSFTTWLYAIVRNTFLDSLKGRAGHERRQQESLTSAAQGTWTDAAALPDEQLALREERDRLWAAIAEIPAEFRTALVLYEIEGLSYDQIAAVEGTALGTIKSRVSRGRERLGRILRARPTGTDEGGNRRAAGFVSPSERAEDL